MIRSLSDANLKKYVESQLNTFFPDADKVVLDEHYVVATLKRVDHCFSFVTLKHYFNGQETIFNHLYSDHYVMFVWYLSNQIFRSKGKNTISDKLYYLNKTLHGLDCMYDTKLPDIFLIFHGVGTMLGKAEYSNYFVALQGCTIGSHKGKYPIMGQGVSLTAHSSIIGDCNIGNNVSISAYTNIFQADIADNNVVYRSKKGEIVIANNSIPYAQQFFNVDLHSLANII